MSKVRWGRNLIAIVLVAALASPAWPAESAVLIFETVNDKDTVTFYPAKISEAKLRQLMMVSPHIVSYFNDFQGTELGAAGSDNAGVFDKVFFALPLELCLKKERAYSHCEANGLNEPNFLHNPKINLEKSKRGLSRLQSLEAPKELQPVMAYLVQWLRWSIWMEETKFRYYSTWDKRVLEKVDEGIDPEALCGDTFRKLQKSESKDDKYNVVAHEWANCVRRAIGEKLGTYPVASWHSFLQAYGIKEDFQEIGPPD